MANSRNERRKRNKAVTVREDPYDIQHVHAEDVVVGMQVRSEGIVQKVTKVDSYLPPGIGTRYTITTDRGVEYPSVTSHYLVLMVYNAQRPTDAERRAAEKARNSNA